MNKYPPLGTIGMQTCQAAESMDPAVEALINARNRARDHRNSEIESFTLHLQSHARCVDHYDREIKAITHAIGQLCPQMSGEACAGSPVNECATVGKPLR